jgi:guanylate kinase
MSEKLPDNNAGTELVKRPLLIVLSGPSGVGKDAVLHHLKKSSPSFKFVTTMTTRPRRHNEKDNVDYHFVSQDEFEKLLKNNELLESANVYGNWYGVPKEPIRQALKQGDDIIVKVDVQGAATIKKLAPQAVFIFLMPPSIDELTVRLKQRYTESAESLAIRLQACDNELKQISSFDYVVINHRNQIESAVDEIKAIITAEKCRVQQREINLL